MSARDYLLLCVRVGGCFHFISRTLSRNIRTDRSGSMPQEMSSGGMDGWIVVHEEKTRTAGSGEEGGEECWAPEISEWILFPVSFCFPSLLH